MLVMDMQHMRHLIAARRKVRDGTARSIRINAGLTLAQLAALVGVSESAISRSERCERNPRPDVLLRWMEVLDELERATNDTPSGDLAA